ncbi:MAG TPA: cation transporter [Syntrophorhabdaceae bacterium]|nr:cation transporter [Syntrophorhabdaceae bacterium]
MTKASIKIGGMSCQHCVAAVGKALTSIKGVQKVDISIGSAYIEYDEKKASIEDFKAAIEKEGYKVLK